MVVLMAHERKWTIVLAEQRPQEGAYSQSAGRKLYMKSHACILPDSWPTRPSLLRTAVGRSRCAEDGCVAVVSPGNRCVTAQDHPVHVEHCLEHPRHR